MDSDVISRFKPLTTYWCVTRGGRVEDNMRIMSVGNTPISLHHATNKLHSGKLAFGELKTSPPLTGLLITHRLINSFNYFLANCSVPVERVKERDM